MIQSVSNPNGIPYHSPGLRQRCYPGIIGRTPLPTPTGLRPDMGDSWECYATPLGLKIIIGYVLRVAAFAATLSFMTQPRWGKKLIFTFNLTAMGPGGVYWFSDGHHQISGDHPGHETDVFQNDQEMTDGSL